ncbi:metallophosphoesterase [Entomomonas sp. E2T0]|uniref:metallophosphoesterase n=1 Tax=Entomomonas sp. E2T0 TaxID=2930213 RepID=UPI002228362C|nr:metallophosphoesterase [Entomomonas sp. E2T0]UYZ83912.1 metallophosphoesterase [Entomomonas sp. E2T0]
MWLDPKRGYDIIGDIHGCANALSQLLEQLGYSKQQGVWRHPKRMALFLGDIVDRGPHIRGALHIVKAMVDAGQAICLMGNHEYYSLGWFTPRQDKPSEFVHAHNARNKRIINETLEQFAAYPDEWQEFLQWFYSLPLFIDAGRFRLVHAYWDQLLINQFKELCPNQQITPELLQQSVYHHSVAYKIFDHLLKGLRLPLLDGQVLVSKDGYARNVFRAKFWADHPETYQDVVFQPDALPHNAMITPLTDQQKHSCSVYSADEPLLFVGHYWCEGMPAPIQNNLACLDYSAVKYGKLVAYRLDDETRIDRNKFVWINVERPH